MATTVDFTHQVKLSGTLPSEIGHMADGGLESLQLVFNGGRLSGILPTQLGGLSKLSTLNLVSTKLSGTLPSELGRALQVETSKTLNIKENTRVSGVLPTQLGLLKLGETLKLSETKKYGLISGTLPTQVCASAKPPDRRTQRQLQFISIRPLQLAHRYCPWPGISPELFHTQRPLQLADR